jgi:hypothetical protein
VPGFQKLGIGGGHLQGYGCQGLSVMAAAMAAVELARVDGSCSTFFLVHTFLATLTLGLLGSEEQKRELLPDMATFRWGRGCAAGVASALLEPPRLRPSAAGPNPPCCRGRVPQEGWVLGAHRALQRLRRLGAHNRGSPRRGRLGAQRP